MLIVTTPNIEGNSIKRYVGLVTGEAILGANIFRDFFAGVRDVVGGRSTAYEKELRKAKQIAIDEMVAEARDRGANAVVSLDLDYATLTSSNGNMMLVSANGTAVVLSDPPPIGNPR